MDELKLIEVAQNNIENVVMAMMKDIGVSEHGMVIALNGVQSTLRKMALTRYSYEEIQKAKHLESEVEVENGDTN